MMKSFVLLALVGYVATQSNVNSRFAGRYVFDLLRPVLTAEEVQTLMDSRDGTNYPTYSQIPQTNFNCASKNQAGFYADVDAQCQVFHRCDLNGNQTSYLCVNTTVFNQITLVCDYFYNVDCAGSQQYEDFANSRLYTDQPLFDSPPADYVAPSQAAQAERIVVVAAPRTQQVINRGNVRVSSGNGLSSRNVQTISQETQTEEQSEQQQ